MSNSVASESFVPEPASALRIGDKVQIIGEPGFFLICGVDRRRHTVNLVPMKAGSPQFGVHRSAILPASSGPVSSVFQRDLKLIHEILDVESK